MAKSDTGNPCIKLCKFDDAGMCRGCYRTRTEVRHWKRLGNGARAAILARVSPLIERMRTGAPSRKRMRKLDRKIRKLEKKLAKLRLERAEAAPAAVSQSASILRH